MTQMNETVTHAHRLEGFICSKCPRYSKLSTDSRDSYRDSSGIFHRSRKNCPGIRMEGTTEDSRAMSNEDRLRELTRPGVYL